LCGGITAFSASVAAVFAVASLSGSPATHFVVAYSVPLALASIVAVSTRAGSAVATMATVMTLVQAGAAIVNGLAGDFVLMSFAIVLSILTALSFVKMVRTCAL
jgi:hypothetical protein